MSTTRTSDLLSRMARIIAADGYEQGLQPVQWQALRYLARANRFSRTPSGMTAWLGQTKGSVSQTIAALVNKGFVVRSRDDKDQRIVRLNLTKTGRALSEAPVQSGAEEMLDALSLDEQHSFSQMSERMLQTALAKNGYRAFGFCHECRHFERNKDSIESHRCGLLNVELTHQDSREICIEQEAA
jgi:DNA-binding MarR family transcriptional regulator